MTTIKLVGLSWNHATEIFDGPPVEVELPLDRPCGACEGSGVTYSPEWREWNRRFDDAQDQAARDELSANMPNEPEEPLCPECEGIKSIPTSTGMDLLAFVDRYRGGRP